MENNVTQNKKKRTLAVTLSALTAALIIAAVTAVFMRAKEKDAPEKSPAVSIASVNVEKANGGEEFSVDIRLSALGDEIYPSASFSIAFDPSKLEFTGIDNGDVRLLGGELPDWSVDAEHSNEIGRINVMYLDMTGGKYAFSGKELGDDGEVLIQLRLRLKENANVGESFELAFADAVFAAFDDEKSLAVSKGSLKTENGAVNVT